MVAFTTALPLHPRHREYMRLCKSVRNRSAVVVMSASRTPLEIVRDAQAVYSKDKPPWCQPWTIVGTGAAMIAGSWTIFHGLAVILALGTTGAVLIWWYLFLVLYPHSVLNER